MLSPCIAWETEHGIGIDLTEVVDVAAALLAVASTGKSVAWLYIAANQLTPEVMTVLARIEHVEVIDFGDILPCEEVLIELFQHTVIDFVDVTDDRMRKEVLDVLNQNAPQTNSAIDAASRKTSVHLRNRLDLFNLLNRVEPGESDDRGGDGGAGGPGEGGDEAR